MISISASFKSGPLTGVELTSLRPAGSSSCQTARPFSLGQNSISERSFVIQAKCYSHLRLKPTGESSESLENITGLFHRANVNLDVFDSWGIWIYLLVIRFFRQPALYRFFQEVRTPDPFWSLHEVLVQCSSHIVPMWRVCSWISLTLLAAYENNEIHYL